MTELRPASDSPAEVAADVVLVGLHLGTDGPHLAAGADPVDAAMQGGLLAALTALGATGKAEELTRIPSSGAVPAAVIAAVGLGPQEAPAETVRRAVGGAVRQLAGKATVALALPTDADHQLRAVTEGALLGAYSFDAYRTNGSKRPPVATLLLLGSGPEAADACFRATVVAEAVHLSRDLVNTPPGDLPPAAFADRAAAHARGSGLLVEVLDETQLAAQGYGGLTGVGQGSSRPPRLLRLEYPGPPEAPTVALVGKGITFDSGGLSIKPAGPMEWMKSDMAGAAAVVAAVTAAARLDLPVRVIAYAALAENMPSGSAIRPSDVLRLFGGTTVEVMNTDAEGRLVLGDALARAAQDTPNILIDLATLTGAQIVALGSRTVGVMSNDAALRTAIVAAADEAGEQAWPMPLPAEMRGGFDSTVADMKNTGDAKMGGGMLAAGVFLSSLVPDGVRWAHVDIAGPAFNQAGAYGYTPGGGTGVMVRTLLQLLETAPATDLLAPALP